MIGHPWPQIRPQKLQDLLDAAAIDQSRINVRWRD
jgi:hypothetical protein